LILVLVLLLALVGLFLVLRPDSPAAEDFAGTSESSTPESATEGQEEIVVDLDIREGVITPDEITVDEGEAVVLRMTSDEPLEFHLHGYDLEEEVEPGEPVELAFDATTTGRFEIENHDTDAVLGVLLVQPR
jgi:heme/copper-type cytochrome/quinol oxidase subunit 2